jgi:hypothetical protein
LRTHFLQAIADKQWNHLLTSRFIVVGEGTSHAV